MSSPALTRIAIFASGNGTTAQTLIEACAKGEVPGEVVLVISNQSKPGVFERVRSLNKTYGLSISTAHISSRNFPAANSEVIAYGRQSKAEELEILRVLKEYDVEFVALLGYMKLVGASIVRKYGWHAEHDSLYDAHMVNTHPGILPNTKGEYGIHVQEFVLAHPGTPAGHSLFAVDAEYDGGPVFAEHRVAVQPDDSPESLFERVKESERSTIAADIAYFLIKQQEENHGR